MGRGLCWPFSGRPVCNSLYNSIGGFCLSIPRSIGDGGERPFPALGQLGQDISFPFCSNASEGCSSSPSVPKSRGPYCSILCSIKLVHQSPLEISSYRPSPGVSFSVSGDLNRVGGSSSTIFLLSSCLAFIRVGLSASGLDRRAIQLTLKAHRPSTCRQYQSVLALFRFYVLGNGCEISCIPTKSLLRLLCNFLDFAHNDLNLSYRTVTSPCPTLYKSHVELISRM